MHDSHAALLRARFVGRPLVRKPLGRLFCRKRANAPTTFRIAGIIVAVRVIMKDFTTRFRQAGSFIAGLLIGLSIVVPVFAMMIADPSGWQTLWVCGASVLLACGLTLQVVVTSTPRYRRMAGPKVGALPIGFIGVDS
jgi:hypothetical protein